ncbi:MAG: hypothetical protein Q27BB25_04665 [Blastomonas sp. CACIA14H2]|uniref:hypothetical protein n=1 Tax=Blastomonas sp. CACIA14H2 TaxID=1419876 RepID=UPI0003D06E68|nr:MAG: hypothetical protein Q27BB25_04665 [Blastomonas sp. CACIA14H2]
MPVELPNRPASRRMGVRMIDYGGTLTPGLGGPTQRINRNGNRFAISVQLPPMIADDARAWLAALNAGVEEGVIWRFRQVDLFPGSPGNVVVNGNGQAGKTLAVRGCNANYPFRRGQFFNLVEGGRRYLHQVFTPIGASSDGRALLPIRPALRVEPSDGSALIVGQPVIEGLLEGNGFSYEVDEQDMTNIGFTIVESR